MVRVTWEDLQGLTDEPEFVTARTLGFLIRSEAEGMLQSQLVHGAEWIPPAHAPTDDRAAFGGEKRKIDGIIRWSWTRDQARTLVSCYRWYRNVMKLPEAERASHLTTMGLVPQGT